LAGTATYSINDWRWNSEDDVTNCGWDDGRGGLLTWADYVEYAWSETFPDPVPDGQVLIGVSVRLWVAQDGLNPENGLLSVYLLPGEWRGLDGWFPPDSQIGAPIDIATLPQVWCGTPGSLAGVSLEKTKKQGFAFDDGYVDGAHVGFMFVVDDGDGDPNTSSDLWMDVRAELTLTWALPEEIRFELRDFSPETERRVLISTGMDEAQPNGVFTYSSSHQTEDGRLRIRAQLFRAGEPEPFVPVYFWIDDPRSSAPYESTGAGYGDNHDAYHAGLITFRDVAGKVLSVVSATTDQDGWVETELIVTDRYGGDNYRIIASSNPDLATGDRFSCYYTRCWFSGTFTAWKRVYLEADRMFKKGAFLTQPVAASPDAPVTVALESIPKGVGKNKYLMFIHSPSIGSSGTPWSEVVKVTGVNNKNKEVTVEHLTYGYEGPENYLGDDYRYLADAVGVISGPDGPTDGDLWNFNTEYLQPLYANTFVEYVLLSDDPVPYLPNEPELALTGNTGRDSMTLIPRKWFYHRGERNKQHLLAGARQVLSDLGRANPEPGEPWAWVFDRAIEIYGPLFGARDRLRGEATVHELTHTWGVLHDDEATGSNDQKQWNSPTLFCTMHAGYSCGLDPVCSEFYDGTVAFHFIEQAGQPPNSEYLEIRGKQDPLPYYKEGN
jgi:hypothetical protein